MKSGGGEGREGGGGGGRGRAGRRAGGVDLKLSAFPFAAEHARLLLRVNVCDALPLQLS